MVRIVRSPEGEVVVDTSRGAKRNGRGAYVDPRSECIAALRASRRLSRELEVEIPEAVYDELSSIAAQRGATPSR